MLDKKMEMMLAAANTLTAEDLDCLKGGAAVAAPEPEIEVDDKAPETVAATGATAPVENGGAEMDDASRVADGTHLARASRRRRAAVAPSGMSAGEYERQRTRESKVSTECIGHEREKHDWWPLGTELVGKIGPDTFTATVVENPQVKSNRSILITSGVTAGKVCLTPTRAAIEATEAYRQAHSLGRGGGVTNGWDFWQPRT
jgi:hypothetical protein